MNLKYPINEAHKVLDSAGLLVVESIVLNHDAHLEIVMAELVSGGRNSRSEIDRETHHIKKLILEKTESAIVTDQSRRFRITWGSIVGYLIVDESTGCPERGKSLGRLLSEFSESPFLDYADANFVKYRDESWRHFRLYGVDRIVDVLSYEQPEVRLAGNSLN